MLRNWCLLLVIPALGVGACDDGEMGGIEYPDPTVGMSDAYTWDQTTVTNVTSAVVWEREMALSHYDWETAGMYCADRGMRLPLKSELYALGNWADNHRDEVDDAFADQIFWQGYWSSERHQDKWAWGVDFSGQVQDSIGIPVVGCALPPTKPMPVRCVHL